MSAPLSSENLSLIRALLECGANPDHRLKIPETASHSPTTTTKPPETINNGPTLLHAVLSKKIDNEDVHLFEVSKYYFISKVSASFDTTLILDFLFLKAVVR